MIKTKKINYLLLFTIFCSLFIVHCSLSPAFVQSQSLEINILLTWSTDTYVPLDYPGKALPTRGSNIEVVANIDSQGINSQELAYNWFLNDQIQKASSGQGNQVFRFNIGNSINRKHLIKVEIRNTEGTLLGISSYLSLKAFEPEIVLKTNIPSLQSSDLIPKYQISANQKIEFAAWPYFFNIKNIDELEYNWQLGEKEASQINSNNPNIFVLKIGQLIQSITRNLSVWVENKNNPIQKTQATAEIILIP